MEQFFRVGIITGPHGIRGTLRVFPKTDNPERFLDLKTVYYSHHDSEEILGTYTIKNVAFQQNMVLLTFEEITDRDAAEAIRGQELWVDREHAQALSEGEYYMADLIGARMVEDNGTEVGVVKDYMETGSSILLLVEDDSDQHDDQHGHNHGNERMIPFIKDVIRQIDIEKGEIIVHMLPGLRDL